MRGGDSFGGKGNGIATASGDHPKTLLVLIFLEHSGSNGVGHPLAVGTQLGLGDVANLEVIVNGYGARSGRSRLRGCFLSKGGERENQNKHGEGNASNHFHAENSSVREMERKPGA